MKYLLYIFLAITCERSFAQTAFYLKPTAGIGTSNSFVSGRPTQDGKSNNILAYNFHFDFSYRVNNFSINAGLGYMRTGREYQYVYAYIGAVSHPTTYHAEMNKLEHYNHFVIPLSVGYSIRLSEKLLILPAIGAEFSYNNSATYKISSTTNNFSYDESHIYAGKEFAWYFNKFSLWGFSQLNLECQIDDYETVTFGPDIHYMMTNIVKSNHTNINGINDLPNKLNNYAVFFSVGFKYRLSARHSDNRSIETRH
jgi:hypothetical protein